MSVLNNLWPVGRHELQKMMSLLVLKRGAMHYDLSIRQINIQYFDAFVNFLFILIEIFML
mgnify:FL=1